MPSRRLEYIPGELQFITASTYRRTPLFRSQPLCRCLADALFETRKVINFLLIGWVLMPKSAAATSRILQRLKVPSAMQILNLLRENQGRPWRRKMLSRLALQPTVHDESHHRVWQRRFYPYSIYSEKK